MIERLIYNVLKSGITTFQKEPKLLEDLFIRQYELTTAEFEAIKTYFQAHPPEVCHGYAHEEQKFPALAIILESEVHNEEVLADDSGQVEDEDDPDYRRDVLATLWQHNYSVLVYTEHPDVTLYYYEMAKAIFQASQDTFINYGLYNLTYSGMDLAPDPRYIPEHLFLRRLTFKCESEFQTIDRQLAKAFKVAGMSVDSSGSPSDVGGVATNVKPYGR